MRPLSIRTGIAAGALFVVVTAGALAQGPPTVTMRITDLSVVSGEPVRVTGSAGREMAGRSVDLEFAPRGGSFVPVAGATVGRNGRFRVGRVLPRSGLLRVSVRPSPGTATAAAASSRAAAVSVASRVRIGVRRLNVTAGRRTTVSGRLVPAVRGTAVSLQVRRSARWVPLDRARTSVTGRFALRDRTTRTGSAPVRVVAAPQSGLDRSRVGLGRLNVYRTAQASWYGPGFYGQRTGCGGRLGYGQLGVAHKSLPCGTKVTFRHRGRTVRVPVIDRGPYVGNREFDLTAPTARRLGFVGHGPILTTR